MDAQLYSPKGHTDCLAQMAQNLGERVVSEMHHVKMRSPRNDGNELDLEEADFDT